MNRSELHFGILFRRILHLFYRPASVFEWIASEGGGLWKLPLTLLSALTVLRILAGGWFQTLMVAQGEIQLPPDWIYYTPEMQAQYMQAAEATKSPVFVYVIPVLIGLTAIWLGWIVMSSLLHLAFTVIGGRGTNSSALNLVAWAALPFSLRELLRIIYVLFAQHPIVKPGLSGFISVQEGSGVLFAATLLALTDIFLFWHIVLLVIGAQKTETVTKTKSLVVVFTLIALSLVIQAGTSFLGSQMNGMMVTRPFFF